MPTDIVKRRVDVYPQSWEQRERWEKAAEKKGMPLSKFIVYIVDEHLHQSPEEEQASVANLKREIANKTEELNELKRELARMKKLLSIQDEELEDYRNKAFVEKSFTGIRTYSRALVDSLRNAGKPLTNDELLQKLGIPPNEAQRIKAISAQLESLSAYGLVKYSAKGWRWVD